MGTDPELAAELAILTAVLDEAGVDILQSLLTLAAEARAAVSSYVGLTVLVEGGVPPLSFTSLDDGFDARDIRTSLSLGPAVADEDRSRFQVSVILFAGVAGAFVDLTADGAWLTGGTLDGFVLDRHLTPPVARDNVGALKTASVINQALGVLIGTGLSRDEADRELDVRAAAAGSDRHRAAADILAQLP